jgi:hypothetical protein
MSEVIIVAWSSEEKKRQWYEANREKLRAYHRKYAKRYRQRAYVKKANEEMYRRWYLKHRYRMTVEEYESILRKQNGVCAICGKTEASGKRLAVDHRDEKIEAQKNHKSEFQKGRKIRALLCARCNVGIGQFLHNKDLLKAAIKYLEVYDSPHL